tara:strand:- start:1314 stop:1730 length:417 start_codon:yes stop_codon:yes gene_type:complete
MIKLHNNLNIELVKNGTVDMLIGYFSSILHVVIIFTVTFIGIFSFNIKLLTITCIFTTLILFANIVLHDCPISNIEKTRLGDTSVDFINRFFPINYDSSRRYEVQLQYIFIITAIIGLKIIFYFLKDDIKNILEIKYT